MTCVYEIQFTFSPSFFGFHINTFSARVIPKMTKKSIEASNVIGPNLS